MEIFNRVSRLIGDDNLRKLNKSCVAVFGVGGVGGFVVEALVRSGVGKIAVIDSDTVSETNLNRQIIATVDTIGKAKVDVIEKRAKSINPNVLIEKYNIFYLPENADKIDFEEFDYIVDAVDTVTAKLSIIERALKSNKKVISSMGTAGKLNPSLIKICDIKETSVCALARVMRRELKKRGIDKLKVCYSNEEVFMGYNENSNVEEKGNGRIAPPSMIFVPAIAGLTIANEVIKDLINL